MSLMGKLEKETQIKSTAAKFHEVFSCRPHHVSNISPVKIQGCDLHEGDWGNSDSVICWSYVLDGKAQTAKQHITIDNEKNSIIFKILEGDLMTQYKTFKIVLEATPKGNGCVVHWTLEYEKLNANIPEPKTLLEFIINLSKDIDGHLCQQA